MKKSFLLLLSSMMCLGLFAQVVSDGELALVYYMPETQVVADITYTEVHEEAGPFVHFAEMYLGAEDVIEEDAIHYAIQDVAIHTRTRADYNRAYKVVAENGIEMQLLSLNRHGILEGYNIEPAAPQEQKAKSSKKQTDEQKKLPTLPLSEEQLKATTLQQMAECAAKQIYRIRENRMYLLGGEIDHAPADGQAMKLVLKELDEQERQLVELFVGKRTTQTLHKEVRHLLTKSESIMLMRLSESAGIVNNEDESGVPVMMQVMARKQVLGAGKGAPDKKAPQASQIYYNLPGSADITISMEGEVLAEKQIAVAQFGVSVPLARNLFTGKDLPHISFDTQTGNIKSITK